GSRRRCYVHTLCDIHLSGAAIERFSRGRKKCAGGAVPRLPAIENLAGSHAGTGMRTPAGVG
ncbi:MAG: hypothetical protein ACLPPF_24070, partial [Rhodomicrobium sp.]